MAGSVEALEDAGESGDLVEAEHCPRHVGQHEHNKDDHHYHRHSDIPPIFKRVTKVVIVKPWPQTLGPKPLVSKPKPKGLGLTLKSHWPPPPHHHDPRSS